MLVRSSGDHRWRLGEPHHLGGRPLSTDPYTVHIRSVYGPYIRGAGPVWVMVWEEASSERVERRSSTLEGVRVEGSGFRECLFPFCDVALGTQGPSSRVGL